MPSKPSPSAESVLLHPAEPQPNASPHLMVPFKERISYGLGDTACSLVFQMVGSYLLFFYTDVAGIASAAIGTLLLLARVWDGIFDGLMGVLIDRTHTRWGKCRPYFLWGAFPFALSAVLVFTAPHFSPTGKIVYAYFTYLALCSAFTAVNLPVAAMLPSLTDNHQERVSINSLRMICVMGGTLVANYATLPLAKLLGGGDERRGFILTAGLLGSVAAGCLLMTFTNTRERVTTSHRGGILTFRQSLSAIQGNLPWLLAFLIYFATWVGMIMRMQTTVYYLRYNLGRADLVPVMMLCIAAMVPGLMASPYISRRVGKRNTMLVGIAIAVLGTGLLTVAPASLIPLLFAGDLVFFVGKGIAMGVFYAIIADTVDYGEWKTGLRANGVFYAATTIGNKIGIGLGGAAFAWMLGRSGYIANAVQAGPALLVIRSCFAWIPLTCDFIIIGLLLLYRLDSQHGLVTTELELRRAQLSA